MSSTDTSDRVLHQLAVAELQAIALKADLRDLRAHLVSLRAPRQGATGDSPLVLALLVTLAGAGAFAQGCMLAAIMAGVVR